MDKKTKKRIQTIQDKLQNRRQQLANARRQPDEEDGEVERFQREIASLEAELQQLRNG